MRFPRRLKPGAIALGVALLLGVAAPARAAELGPFSCLPEVGYQHDNSASSLMAGYATMQTGSAVSIGTSGNVNWTMNPYSNVSWVRDFHTLRWMQPAIEDYMASGDAAVANRITAIVKDWAHDNPPSTGDAWVGQMTGLRAEILVCLANAIGLPSWLVTILNTHASRLADDRYYAGAWNQGIDQNIGLLGIACKEGRTDWADKASTRMSNDIGKSIDSQGAPNEQAPGYASLLYNRWNLAADKLAECGRPVPSLIATRTALLPTFIAHATQPDGNLVQIGDSYAVPPLDIAGTPVHYVYTKGSRGTPPSELVKVYGAGYVFGRSSWSQFTGQTYYSIHYGPGRAFHGHQDHMSLTYMWKGKPIISDSGHYNYTLNSYRDFLRSPEAHNTMAVTGARLNQYSTWMTGSSIKSYMQYYGFADRIYSGVTRQRSLLFVNDPGFVVVYDRGSTDGSVTYNQYWHIPAGATKLSQSTSSARFRYASTTDTIVANIPMPNTGLARPATKVVIGATSPYQGWVSRSSSDKSKDYTVSFRQSGHSAKMLTVILPVSAGAAASFRIETNGTGWILHVTTGGKSVAVAIGSNGWMGI